MVMLLALAGCQCGPVDSDPDAGEDLGDGGQRADGGVIVLPPDRPVTPWPSIYASEECPAEAFGGFDAGSGDAGLRFGICIALHTLTADAFLDGRPETKPIEVHFQAGGFESEATRLPDSSGVFQVKVMRSRYDNLVHQPGGVWPNFEGFINHGYADMTRDLNVSMRAISHLLRGAVRFGGLPFRPSTFPQDVWFDAYGVPDWQMSMVTSQGGSYELRLLEGIFGLFLSTPASSLYGTELRKYPVTLNRNITFDRDQEFDVDIPTSLLEGSITIDGQPLADARRGTDFTITYTRPGDNEASIFSHHEGGLPTFTSLVPKGQYGAILDFTGAPNRTLPSRIFGKPLQALDLRQDTTLVADWSTLSIEGSILIDGVPPRPNPNYNFQIYMFGMAGATAGSSFLLYEIPMDTASFNIKSFPGLYFTAISLDENLASDLAAGFWVIDRYYELYNNRSMPIALETARFSGRITIDGKAPPPAARVGTFTFRNRALTGQWSWFTKAVVAGEDGSFTVRLPKGDYEVYFTIDRETFPEYASGRELIFSRVPLDRDAVLDFNYETLEIRGPLRVGGEVVRDVVGGPEVGLRMQRQQDFQNFEWGFNGGREDYVLRVPKGSYAMDFVVYENGIPDVAFGNAPMGLKLNVALQGEPFMNFGR
ncbi:MAG TPA: hypothetical protein VGE37_07460 [Archangium sp.]